MRYENDTTHLLTRDLTPVRRYLFLTRVDDPKDSRKVRNFWETSTMTIMGKPVSSFNPESDVDYESTRLRGEDLD